MATYRLALTGGLELSGQIREWVCERARTGGFDEDTVARIALAVSEAVTNIVCHAYEGRTDGRIEATLTVDDAALTLRLRDYGIKFDPDAYQPPDLDIPAEGGYGVFLMHTVMDKVQYETGYVVGTELVLVKER